MQETMSEFKEYFEDEIDDGTKEAYNKALEKLEKLMPYEEALVSMLKYPYMYEVTVEMSKFVWGIQFVNFQLRFFIIHYSWE